MTLALNVRLPIVVVVVLVAKVKLFVAVGEEIVNAPIVRIPADLLFVRALFVGIVITPALEEPKVMLLEPAKAIAPVPVIVIVPVPVLNVLPL